MGNDSDLSPELEQQLENELCDREMAFAKWEAEWDLSERHSEINQLYREQELPRLRAAGKRITTESFTSFFYPLKEADMPAAVRVLYRRIQALRAKLGYTRQVSWFWFTRPKPTDQELRTSTENNAFRRNGAVWEVTFSGKALTPLVHINGMDYIYKLLLQPWQEIPCMTLIGGGEDQPAELNIPDPIIDDRARSEYKARLTQLAIEREHATTSQNELLLGQIEKEFSQIEDELSSSIGPRGPRKFVTSQEKARGNVKKGIDLAIEKIKEIDLELGTHFKKHIHTGHSCSYSPADKSQQWSL